MPQGPGTYNKPGRPKKEKKSKSSKRRSSKARNSLKSFASKIRGKIQSPVHSNGFKQDQLIDMHEGGKNFTGSFSVRAQAGNAARAAGKSYLKFNNVVYKLGTRLFRGNPITTFAADDKVGRVK